MDPFEEFEFKPITEGLGFHQKNKSAPEPAVPPARVQASLPEIELIDETSNPLRPPLPREKAASSQSAAAAKDTRAQAVDEILLTLQQTRRLGKEAGRQEKEDLRKPISNEEYRVTLPSFSAALLDGLLIIAASLLCMIIMLSVTKVDLLANLAQPDTEGFLYLATFSLFAGVTFIYMVVNRVFLGFTPGEWASDLRIGTPKDSSRPRYALSVIARQLLNMVTGFIVLPIASQLLRFDLAGTLTGARVYRKV